MTYFNTDSQQYVSLVPETFEIVVTGGSGQKTYTIDTASTTDETLTLLPAPAVTGQPRIERNLAARPLYWALVLLPLLVGGGLIGWVRYRERRDARDPALLLRERAGKVAAARLKDAKVHLQQVEPRQFYDAVEGALLTYLRDRFSLQVADLSRKNIQQVLTEAGADSELTDRYDRLLGRCEMALYAGQDSAADLGETYATAVDLITETERQLRP